jgi:hypothetical protein
MFNRLKMYFMVLIGKHPYTGNVPLAQRIRYIRKLFRVYGFNKAPKRPKSLTESFLSPWKDAYKENLSTFVNLIN